MKDLAIWSAVTLVAFLAIVAQSMLAVLPLDIGLLS